MLPAGEEDRHGRESRVRALRQRMPPQNQLPARVDAPAVLYRDENLAVGLAVEAFTTGVRFTISVRLARRPTQFPANPVVGLRRHAERMSGPFSVSDQKLRVGVVLADGRRLVGTEQQHFLHQQDALHPGTAILVDLGGRGDGPLAIDLDYWLTPLPPPGAVIVVLDGPDLGLTPTTVPIDGTAIATAAAQATVL